MRRTPLAQLLAGALVAALAGCGESQPEPPLRPGGVVIVDGSSTVFPISRKAADGYREKHPEVTVVVERSGTTGGFEKYLSGSVDIVDASRPARDEELSQAVGSGREWERFTIGYDGITVVVNPANDFVDALSVAQLKQLFEPESTINTWKDLNEAWPDRPIKLFSPDRESGTFDFFTEIVVGEVDSQRKGVSTSDDDNVLVTGVVSEPDGLGYFGYSYFEANSDRLRAVPIQDGPAGMPITPKPETIMEGTYTPLSRPLYIYVRKESLKRPEVAGFVQYYLANAATFARVASYVAPTEEERTQNERLLAPYLKGL